LPLTLYFKKINIEFNVSKKLLIGSADFCSFDHKISKFEEILKRIFELIWRYRRKKYFTKFTKFWDFRAKTAKISRPQIQK
jgi:hypothetical protein